MEPTDRPRPDLLRRAWHAPLVVVAMTAGLIACAPDGPQSTPNAGSETTSPTSTGSTPSPTQASPTEPTGAPTVNDTTPDPDGPGASTTSVPGGSVGRSYAGETYPSELSGIVAIAIDDLAARLGIDASAIAVRLVQEVVWSDAALGCPQPGRSYAQVLTDGLRIVLVADGADYDYRSGGSADPTLCMPPDAAATGSTKATSTTLFDVVDGTVLAVQPPKATVAESLPTEGINPPSD